MRVLALGAHFDDVELGCGGSLVRHVDAGDEVTILVATHSGYKAPNKQVIRKADVALTEGRAAADILGVHDLLYLGLETNSLIFNDSLVCAILEVIERQSINIIYTHWADDIHLDHQILGRATLSAARHVPRVLSYRSNFYDGAAVFHPTIYTDVSNTFERKLTAIRAHTSEFCRAGTKWVEFLRNDARNNGMKVGVEYAEAFQAVRYLL